MKPWHLRQPPVPMRQSRLKSRRTKQRRKRTRHQSNQTKWDVAVAKTWWTICQEWWIICWEWWVDRATNPDKTFSFYPLKFHPGFIFGCHSKGSWCDLTLLLKRIEGVWVQKVIFAVAQCVYISLWVFSRAIGSNYQTAAQAMFWVSAAILLWKKKLVIV